MDIVTVWLGTLLAFSSKALAFILMIAVIAFVHEFGHYFVAKLCRVKVYEFALGFGHKIWARKWGETEYTLRWIPLGAFVRPAGMNPEEDEAEGETDLKGRSFSEKHFVLKQAILAAGAGGNMVFAAGIFASLLYVYGIQSTNIEIKEVLKDKPAAAAGLMPGDVIASLDGKPVTDHQDGIRYINAHPNTSIDVGVLRYAPMPDVTLGGPDLGLTAEQSISSAIRIEVLSVESGKAAEQAGLKPGMMITDVAGKPVSDFKDAASVLEKLRQGPAPLKVLEPKSLTIPVVPALESDGKGRIGISSLGHFFGARQMLGAWGSLHQGVRRTAEGVVSIYQQALVLLWTSLGRMTVPKEVGGPLKIASEIARGVDLGWLYLLQLTASLSLAIGVFNLLPIPALDGGRMFVLLVKGIVEGAHRLIKPMAESHEVLGPRGEEVLHFMGFVFLIFLLVVVSWKDVREMSEGEKAIKPSAPATAPATTPATAPAK